MWKEIILAKLYVAKESQALTKLAQNLLANIEQIKCEAGFFQRILEMAQKEKLSFYSSSYLCIAKQRGLILVTEDKELISKGKRSVDVQTAGELLNSQASNKS